jgi:hypothetical protein
MIIIKLFLRYLKELLLFRTSSNNECLKKTEIIMSITIYICIFIFSYAFYLKFLA